MLRKIAEARGSPPLLVKRSALCWGQRRAARTADAVGVLAQMWASDRDRIKESGADIMAQLSEAVAAPGAVRFPMHTLVRKMARDACAACLQTCWVM
jgi:hypothetical protein